MDSQKIWKQAKVIPSSVTVNYLLFKYVKPHSKIVDIGCGQGRLAIALGLLGYSVTGIDINPNAISKATATVEQIGLSHVNFIQADACNINIADSYDLAIMNAFLTTVIPETNRKKAVQSAYRLLKSGGYLYIADFLQNWDIPLYRERYEDGVKNNLETGTFYVRDDTGAILYPAHHFTTEEILALVDGFKLIDFSIEKLTTRSGNLINGFVLIARK